MDISIPLIFLVLFIVASFSLFLVYKLGIKEKSYEEALAEQRQQTNALLGVKLKPKDKKNKKAAKKSKEKVTQEDSESLESEKDQLSEESNKLHVEFKEEPEELPIQEVPPVKEVKPKRVKKMRPILLKKEQFVENVLAGVVDAPIVNHFELNPPKDEFALLRSNSKDDLAKPDQVKEKQIKNNKKSSKQSVNNTNNVKMVVESTPAPIVEKPIEEKLVETISVPPQSNGLVVGNPGKEKKKKKSEFNTRQQLTAERDGLINSVRKADLSKTEVQLLIDLLLNKQLEAPSVLDDWSEGKSDPVQKLKKQLTEKEKLLVEEQEALVGAQAKLREIRAEQQTEKAQLQHKIRGLEEALQARQLDIQAAGNRQQVSTQKIQQLQADLNVEMTRCRKLVEDNAAMQAQLQQCEMGLAQFQEAEVMLVKLRNDIEQLSAQNQQLHAEKEHQHQNFLIQLANLEKSLEQQVEVYRQLKDSHQELERNLEMSLRQENDWKIEISKLNTAVQQEMEVKRKLEHTIDQLSDELNVYKSEKLELTKSINQLHTELQILQDEKSEANGNKVQESQAYEVDILNLTNQLSCVRNELISVKNEMQLKEKTYKAELENKAKNCTNIQTELEEQRAKNNELRTKNWKVMEALNAAENKCKVATLDKKLEIDVNKLSEDINVKEQVAMKQFLQRLFPDIENLGTITTSEDWETAYGKQIQNYIDSLKTQMQVPTPPPSPQKSEEIEKLQAQIIQYKNIIDETEGILNKLQSHVEKEEMSWRNQLGAKQAQIDNLKEELATATALQKKLISLEHQLSIEAADKQRLYLECQSLKGPGRPQPSTQQGDLTTIEKLSEEVNRLREELRAEQTRNGEVNVCLKAQNNCSNSTNGPALIERCLSSSSSIASSVIDGLNKKPKNKKRKKKGNGN